MDGVSLFYSLQAGQMPPTLVTLDSALNEGVVCLQTNQNVAGMSDGYTSFAAPESNRGTHCYVL